MTYLESERRAADAYVRRRFPADFKVSQLTNPELLEPERLLEVQNYLALLAENYGFLEEEHPLCRYIQEGFSKGREKGKSGMRVRVASTDELLQEALPDGTLVVSQGLLNVIPYKELLLGLAAHELARFELNSSQEEVQTPSFIERIGEVRLLEGEADIRSAFKAVKMGLDSMVPYDLFKAVQAGVYRHDKVQVDPDQGDLEYRQFLQLFLQRHIQFPMPKGGIKRTQVPPEWKRKTKESKSEYLLRETDEYKWLKVFGETSIEFRTKFLSDLAGRIQRLAFTIQEDYLADDRGQAIAELKSTYQSSEN